MNDYLYLRWVGLLRPRSAAYFPSIRRRSGTLSPYLFDHLEADNRLSE